MPTNTLPDAAVLRELLSYDPESGELRWNSRPRDRFATTKGYRIFCSKYAGKVAGSRDGCGHIQIMTGGKLYHSHRVIFKMMTGRDPEGTIDHINRDPGDNRWSNLRDVNVTVNRLNSKTRIDSALGIKGICRRKGKYHVRVGLRSRMLHIGVFDSLPLAEAAYRGAAIAIMHTALDEVADLRTESGTPDLSSRSARPDPKSPLRPVD